MSARLTDLSLHDPVAFDHARVADAMSHGVIHCAPETPLRTVARMMATYGVHAVYVFDDADELLGLVSDLDLAAAACCDIDRRTAGGPHRTAKDQRRRQANKLPTNVHALKNSRGRGRPP